MVSQIQQHKVVVVLFLCVICIKRNSFLWNNLFRKENELERSASSSVRDAAGVVAQRQVNFVLDNLDKFKYVDV